MTLLYDNVTYICPSRLRGRFFGRKTETSRTTKTFFLWRRRIDGDIRRFGQVEPVRVADPEPEAVPR